MIPTALLLGEAVRARRTLRGWAQADLAAAAYLHEETVGRIERGQPSSAQAKQSIAAALGTTVDNLIGDTAA